MTSLMERFLPARTTEVGSRQLVWAALEGGDKGVHGQYVSDFKAQEPSDYIMESADLQERVWVKLFIALSAFVALLTDLFRMRRLDF